jgi:hypothetical protein
VRLPGNASSRNAYVQDTGEVEEYPLSIGCSDPLPSRTRTARAHIQLTKNALPRRNAPGYLKPGSGVSAYAARRATDRNSTTGPKGRSRFAPNLQNTGITRYITLRNTLHSRVSKRSRRSQRSEGHTTYNVPPTHAYRRPNGTRAITCRRNWFRST